jgi:hypothetical protein
VTYTLQEQYNSKNMVPGASADSVWHLGARRVTSITIHHWGLKGQQFDTVRDFLCTNDTPTSAHYVVQDGLVACIVSPDDCAFHAGNAEGNTFSVGIECRPEATDGDYATIAELIRDIRAIYGDIPLYPHNHWFNTACPGDYDLARLDSLARGTIATQSATITPLEDTLSAESEANIIAAVNFAFARLKNEIPNDTAAAVLGRPVPYKDPVTGADTGQTTSLGTVAGFTDFQHNATRASVPAAVLNLSFTLPDGTVTNLAGILSAINAKPVTAGTVVNATDPQTIADAVLSGIRTQWSKP